MPARTDSHTHLLRSAFEARVIEGYAQAGETSASVRARLLRRRGAGYAAELIEPQWRAFVAGAQTVLPREARNSATKFLQRFGDAMQLLCRGHRPDEAQMRTWLDGSSEELQSFAASHSLGWAQGLGVIDAALLLADTPTEGNEHEMR